MDARQRRELTRYGAPAAFLAAVTIAVLLIKAGLNGASNSTTTTGQALPTTTRPTTRAKSTTRRKIPARIYYTIQPGDTLGVIAQRENTTVADLLQLNPGIDPHALHSGQRIRVH